MHANRWRAAALTISVVLVGLDQLIKAWAVRTLPGAPVTVIPGLFKLTYVENRGAAFGIFQNSTVQLSILAGAVLLLLLVAMFSKWVQKPLVIWSVALILAGGAGNCIDRVARSFVVDYLDFSALFGFPVFNLADCCVVVGTGLLLLYILVFEKREGSGEEPSVKEEPTCEDA